MPAFLELTALIKVNGELVEHKIHVNIDKIITFGKHGKTADTVLQVQECEGGITVKETPKEINKAIDNLIWYYKQENK